jgi:hypothetical protein
MSTLQEVSHRPQEQDQKRRPWALIAIAVVAVLAIAGIAWIAFGDDGTSDIDVATELADTFTQGWQDSDPDMVGSVLTDDAIFNTDVPGSHNRRVSTKEETMQAVRDRGDDVAEARRVSELTETGDGIFTYVAEFTTDLGVTYSVVNEIELDGNLASRIEWLSVEHIADS